MNIHDFSYIQVPEMTSEIAADVEHFLLRNGRSKTYKHVTAVADTNMEIAKQYGLDEIKCKLSGLLHDISAVVHPQDMLLFFEDNKLLSMNPKSGIRFSCTRGHRDW